MLGFINVFKPPGPSSTQLGARVRRIYSSRVEGRLAVGHLGTLDPQAAGVLPIALGNATRLIPLIEDRRKAYVCTLVLGRTTATADAEGETVTTSEVPPDAVKRLRAAIPSFIGRIEQTPPMFSAVHHEGSRLYDLARAGKVVERRKRTITMYAISVLGAEGASVRLRVACSEGTYIRTLCEDLGAAIGVAAHMGALLREASGPFVLAESVLLEDIIENPDGALIAPEHVIPFPTIVLDSRAASDFRLGRIVPLDGGSGDKHVFVRDSARVLVGIGETLGTLLAPAKKSFCVKIHHALAEHKGPPLVVAIGFFDGYHLGHREIVRALLRLRKPGYRAAVLTFREHPAAFLRPGNEPPLIATTEERINALDEAGIEELYLLPFDAAFAALSPQAFIDDVLVGKLRAQAVIVGENFRYGAARAGGVEDAAAQLGARGVTFVPVPNLTHDGARVSSSRVRSALLAGDLEVANALLGASYKIEGRVVLGAGRGHDLGFPTANLAVPREKLLPKDGVYSIVARYDGRDYRGLVSIGTNPTFDGTARTVEAWLLDFNRSIYGDVLTIRDLRFVRDQRRFASVDELREQMRADAAHASFPTLSP